MRADLVRRLRAASDLNYEDGRLEMAKLLSEAADVIEEHPPDEFRPRLVEALRDEAARQEGLGFAEFIWYRQLADRIEVDTFPSKTS